MELIFCILSYSIHCWATEFCKLIFVSFYFVEGIYDAEEFLEEFSWSFRYTIMSSANKNSLTSSFPI
jgi:hypothetical protein